MRSLLNGPLPQAIASTPSNLSQCFRLTYLRLFIHLGLLSSYIGNEVSRLQWEGALGVLSVQKGDLDLKHIQTWADRIGLSHLFDRAIHESA